MKLNLREIIEIPGGSVPFAQELDTALLDFPSVRAYTAPITAEGKVVNTAGILTLQGKLHAQMLCVCDRCGADLTPAHTHTYDQRVVTKEATCTEAGTYEMRCAADHAVGSTGEIQALGHEGTKQAAGICDRCKTQLSQPATPAGAA